MYLMPWKFGAAERQQSSLRLDWPRTFGDSRIFRAPISLIFTLTLYISSVSLVRFCFIAYETCVFPLELHLFSVLALNLVGPYSTSPLWSGTTRLQRCCYVGATIPAIGFPYSIFGLSLLYSVIPNYANAFH